jgi:hypothetical protein
MMRQVHGKALKNSGSFSAEDEVFVTAQLKHHFEKERMFAIAPNSHQGLSAAAKALVEAELMDDLKFKERSEETTARPNPLVLEYFARMLPQWRGAQTVVVTLRDVLSEFNRGNEGMYRRACVVPFMRPFTDAGAVEITDANNALLIHVGRVEAQLQK